MTNKESDLLGDHRETSLDCAEWNFKDLPPGQRWACMAYELLRESASVREEATDWLGFFHGKVKKAGGRIPAIVPLPDSEKFRENYTGSRILTLVYMKSHGFPELPWQQIKDPSVRDAIGENLRLLSTLPKRFDHDATLSAAVNVVSLVQDDELRAKLQKEGVKSTAALC